MENTKKVTTTMTQTLQDKAKRKSCKMYGKSNLSRYIVYLIEQDLAKDIEVKR